MVRYTDAPHRSVATITVLVSPKVWTMMCHNLTGLAAIPLLILSRECIEVANGYQDYVRGNSMFALRLRWIMFRVVTDRCNVHAVSGWQNISKNEGAVSYALSSETNIKGHTVHKAASTARETSAPRLPCMQ
jgi:hypothetical protein